MTAFPPPVSVDVEALLVQSLSATLGVAVATEVPSNRPPLFVHIQDAGGPDLRRVVIDETTVNYEAWAPTDVDASDLARSVRDALIDLPRLRPDVLYTRVGRPRSFRDESSPRFVGSAIVAVRRDL